MIIEKNKIYLMDCLEGMKHIPDKSIDMILCDLPYGCTQNNWDSKMPLNSLWAEYNRIIKDSGVIALTAQGVFSAELLLSNKKYYRYSLVWEKSRPVGFLNAKKMPLRAHEDILIFYKKLPVYNPVFDKGKPYKGSLTGHSSNYGSQRDIVKTDNDGFRYPRSVIKIKNKNTNSLHPTQKPVELFEYLIKTYTDEGGKVLDNCMGSGTTAIAAINTNRNYIGFEKEQKYFDISQERIRQLNNG